MMSDSISRSYNDTHKALNAVSNIDLVSLMLSNLTAIDFDEIAVTYGTTTDVYVLKKATSTVATLTVTFSDATKKVASKIVKS